MRRTGLILLALALSLVPAVWARRMATYPGWAGEIALRSVGCDSISTRLSGWTVLPPATEATGAAAAVGRIVTDLGFSGQSTASSEYILAVGLRPGATITVQATLRDGRWLASAELTCASDARAWYRTVNAALAAAGTAGRTHVAVIGLRSNQHAGPSELMLARTICNSILATVTNTVADGASSHVISGDAGLVVRQPGDRVRGGSFALSLQSGQPESATAITLSTPGLR